MNRITEYLRASSVPSLQVHLRVAHTGQNYTDTVPAGSARAGPHPTPTQGLAAAVSQYSHPEHAAHHLERVRRTHTTAEAEAPSLCPPDRKSQHVGKDPDAGKIEGQGEGASLR